MTSLQELIHKLESFKKELKEKYDGDPLVTLGFSVAINEAKELIEKEKKQIVEAFYQGRNFYNDFDDDPELYYDDTYKQ